MPLTIEARNLERERTRHLRHQLPGHAIERSLRLVEVECGKLLTPVACCSLRDPSDPFGRQVDQAGTAFEVVAAAARDPG